MRITFLLTFVLLSTISTAAYAGDFTVLAAPYPPYCVSKGLTVKGTSISALNVIMTMCGHPLADRAFKLTPWAYAYEYTARTSGRIVVNARRTGKNEALYKWVGPIVNSRIVLYGRKKDNLHIPHKADLEQYRIATVRWSRPEKILLDGGLAKSELLRTATHVTSLRKLDRGEVDLFATDELGAPALFEGLGMNPDDYEVCHVFREEPLYFAFSRDADDQLIARLNKALSTLKNTGMNEAAQFTRMTAADAAPENDDTATP